jgi:serine protease
VYWSPPATLVSPNLWNLIGSAYYADVPPGRAVQVSDPGITWPADKLPGPGHYCFVAAVGNADDPGPNPGSFANFDDFVNYIYANNTITWRNFNVVAAGGHHIKWGEFIPLRFLIIGAWDKPRAFALELHAELPEGSRLALQVPRWLGRGLKRAHTEFEEIDDRDTDPNERQWLRLWLNARGTHPLREIELPTNTTAASHMLVHVPAERHVAPHRVVVRQLYGQREVGRITWLILPHT